MATSTPSALLDRALRRDPARPLLTFYDDATDERTELSVATFANWVAKTANFLQEDLDAGPGDAAAIDLPLHWQAAVWLQACWASGVRVVPTGPADVVVLAYGGEPPPLAPGSELVALGLGTMGLARRDVGPPGWTTLDFDRSVHGHADRFVPLVPPSPDAPALTVNGRTATAAELAARAAGAAAEWTGPPGGRLLVTDPLRTVSTVLAGLLLPLAGELTAVLCRNPDPARMPSRIDQEQLVATAGPAGWGLPGWEPPAP